jgi:hypothetical protein
MYSIEFPAACSREFEIAFNLKPSQRTSSRPANTGIAMSALSSLIFRLPALLAGRQKQS